MKRPRSSWTEASYDDSTVHISALSFTVYHRTPSCPALITAMPIPLAVAHLMQLPACKRCYKEPPCPQTKPNT